ncbi:MAG: hypothetical protein AB2385_11015 [Symbiobacterium sp.]|uniref:hypothetical protein n=1 Tax=Symbiobacterium sp. TaxID=1971213 RepID=UPI0034639375
MQIADAPVRWQNRVYTHNTLECIAAITTALKVRRVPDAPVSPHLRPVLGRLLSHKDHPAMTLSLALLALGFPEKELARFACLHGPLPAMERLGDYPADMLRRVPVRRLREIFRCEDTPEAVLDLYADALRSFWAASRLADALHELQGVVRQAVQEVQALTDGADYARQVAELLGLAEDIELHFIPVVFFARKMERCGFDLPLPGRRAIVLCFGYEGFPDAAVDGLNRQWLRLGSYYHVAQALLQPFFPALREEVQRSAALVEPLRGLPSFAQYKDWQTTFYKHVVTAVCSILERRHIGEYAYRYLARYHAGSGMLYTGFFADEFERLIGMGTPLATALRELARRVCAAQKVLLAKAASLEFQGSLKECLTPYWAARGPARLYVGSVDAAERERLISLVQRAWGAVDTGQVTSPPEFTGRPVICCGPATDPVIRRLLSQVDITIAPTFIRVRQSTYHGEHLHLLAVGRQPDSPSAWWALHATWESRDVQDSPPLSHLASDYVIMRGGQVVGEGNYVLELVPAGA